MQTENIRQPKRSAFSGQLSAFSAPFQVPRFTARISHFTVHTIMLLALCSSALLISEPAEAQIRSGAAFLKILPGTRQQGLATSLTGSIDEMYALYANPAATGFLREWQWAFNYTEWFVDTYNLSVNYGRKWRSPWSRNTRVALGLYYQGVRDFESTDGAAPAASANDMLLTFSYGDPITFISRNLSVGGNIKYLRSKLADFTASSLIFDVGLLYRTDRYRINTGLFDYAIFSAGVAVTQLGKSLSFISEETPLPKTARGGIALNLGKHNGLQVQLTGDYQKVEDESGRISFGAEIGWGYLLAFRTGYNFTNNILSKFAMGLSVRLDDLNSPIKSVLPGRNNALRVDMATLENNDFFSSSYRAGANYYPIAPEGFETDSEFLNSCAGNGNVKLVWEMTEDPDLYDNVTNTLFLMREDSLRLEEVMEQFESNEFDFDNQTDPTLQIITDPALFTSDKKSRLMSYTFFAVQGGNYYWTVMATDIDKHVRFAKKIQRFNLPAPSQPDLLITRIDFHLNQNEMMSNGNNGGCQGEINITISNQSKCTANDFSVNVYDSLNVDPQLLSMNDPEELPTIGSFRRAIYQTQISELLPGEHQRIAVPWQRSKDGSDYIIAHIDEENVISERDELNNSKKELIALPELDIKITATPNNVTVGDTVHYTLRVKNSGSARAENFYLHNEIPRFLSFADSSFSLAPDSTLDRYVSWRFGNLEAGEVREITYLTTVDSAVSDIMNVSKIFAPCDILPLNNVDTTVVEAITYDLELTKRAAVDPLRPKVKFDLNKSTLTASTLQQLDILGRALQSGLLEKTFIKIEGHTDLQGFRGQTKLQSRKSNQKLSEDRARAVKNYLTSNFRIAPDRICDIGYGQDRPISQLHEENRRVEINILKNTISCDEPVDPDLIIPAVYQQSNIAYTIRVRNAGPHTARNVAVIDSLPDNVSLVPNSYNQPPEDGIHSPKTLRWYLPMVAVGETADITFKVKVDSIPSHSPAYELRNRSQVETQFDSDKRNNSDETAVYAIAGIAPPKTRGLKTLRIHKVKAGETLAIIAKIYFNDPSQWRSIQAANQNELPDPDFIFPGQELFIPDGEFRVELTLPRRPPEPPRPTEPNPTEPRPGRRIPRLSHSDLRADKS